MTQTESGKHSLNLALSTGLFLILSVIYSIVLVDPRRGCELSPVNQPQQLVLLNGQLALYSPGYVVVSIPNKKPISVIRCGTGKSVSRECRNRLNLLKPFLGQDVTAQVCGAVAFETRKKSDNIVIWSGNEAQSYLDKAISSRKVTRLTALTSLMAIVCFGLYSAYRLKKTTHLNRNRKLQARRVQ